MKKKVYVLRTDDDMDYIKVFTTISKAIKTLVEELKEDYIFLTEEEIAEIKERAEYGYEYAYTSDDTPFNITWTYLE